MRQATPLAPSVRITLAGHSHLGSWARALDAGCRLDCHKGVKEALTDLSMDRVPHGGRAGVRPGGGQ